MGRRSRRERDLTSTDPDLVATDQVLPPSVDLSLFRSILPEIEDRRLFDPTPLKPARGVLYEDTQVVPRPSKPLPGRPVASLASRPEVFGFRNPKHVAVCARREARREVLFAKRKTGAGSRARWRRRNEYSDVSCK